MSSQAANPGVLVGVDGSRSSKRAVQWAAHEARMRNVPLTLVHVVVTPSWGPAPWLLSNQPLPLPAEEDPELEKSGRKIIADAIKIAEEILAKLAILKSTVSCSFRCPCRHLWVCPKRREL